MRRYLIYLALVFISQCVFAQDTRIHVCNDKLVADVDLSCGQSLGRLKFSLQNNCEDSEYLLTTYFLDTPFQSEYHFRIDTLKKIIRISFVKIHPECPVSFHPAYYTESDRWITLPAKDSTSYKCNLDIPISCLGNSFEGVNHIDYDTLKKKYLQGEYPSNIFAVCPMTSLEDSFQVAFDFALYKELPKLPNSDYGQTYEDAVRNLGITKKTEVTYSVSTLITSWTYKEFRSYLCK